MNRTGKTVFLDVHPDVLFRRLRVAKQQRPILQGKEDDELKAFIVQALEKRAPFYHQAQYIFNADELEDRWQIETSVQCLRQLWDCRSNSRYILCRKSLMCNLCLIMNDYWEEFYIQKSLFSFVGTSFF